MVRHHQSASYLMSISSSRNFPAMALEDHVCHDNAIQNFVSARPVSIYAGLWLYARLTDDWQNGLPGRCSLPRVTIAISPASGSQSRLVIPAIMCITPQSPDIKALSQLPASQ
jgi:hypothetical protein